jgi:hypothetical protein
LIFIAVNELNFASYPARNKNKIDPGFYIPLRGGLDKQCHFRKIPTRTEKKDFWEFSNLH